MTTYQCETNLTLGQEAESVPKIFDTFRNPLSALSANETNPIDVLALTNGGLTSSQLVDGLVNGTYNFAYGSGNRFPPDGDEFLFAHLFGMEVHEFCSWWYEGTPGIGALVGSPGNDSGEALAAAQIAAEAPPYNNMIVFPINVGPSESGGWYKEAVTMKKLRDGVYSDGSAINIRLADEAKPAHQKAFPNVGTPSGTPATSFLGDVFLGTFSAGEFSSPLGDSSTTNGLFPNYPNGAGGVIEAGLKHYYMGSWHTPFRGRILMVNKSWHDALPAQQQAMIRAAAYQSHMQNVAYQHQGQDSIIAQFQALGATVHEQLPPDVLGALREGVDEVYYEEFGGKGAEYSQMRDHQREFIKANQVRWRSGTVDRRWRFQSRLAYEATLQPNSRY